MLKCKIKSYSHIIFNIEQVKKERQNIKCQKKLFFFSLIFVSLCFWNLNFNWINYKKYDNTSSDKSKYDSMWQILILYTNNEQSTWEPYWNKGSN